MLTSADIANLDTCIFAYEIVEKGQGELGLDYIDIVEYMQDKHYTDKVINSCFRVYSGKDIRVT